MDVLAKAIDYEWSLKFLTRYQPFPPPLLYALLVAVFPFLYKWFLLSLEPSAADPAITLRVRWPAPAPAQAPAGASALEAPAAPRAVAPPLEAPSHAGARVSPLPPASRPAPALSIPPLLTRLLAPKEGPISSGLRAGMSPEAVNTRFVASSNAAALSEATNGPLPGKAAKLATKALSFAWMWIQMIVLKLVEPLLSILGGTTAVGGMDALQPTLRQWKSEVLAVGEAWQRVIKRAGTNLPAFLMASELAKAYLVPIVAGYWPALAMGRLPVLALDAVTAQP